MAKEQFDEIWKDILGLEDKYQVSTLGRIKSLEKKVRNTSKSFRIVKESILTSTIKSNGYLISRLGKGHTYHLHRLVAQAFIPNPENKPQVNHKDGNKLNNHVDNLEWITHSENMQHACKTGLFVPNFKKYPPKGKLNRNYKHGLFTK